MPRTPGKILLFTLLFLAGCSLSNKSAPRYFVPPPPDTPRVEWLGTYSSEKDFPNYDARRRLEYLTGVPPLNPLRAPSGIASDNEGKVFVGDLLAKNIIVFDLEAQTLSTLLEESDVSARQMTFDSRKQLYVADTNRRIVRVFSREGKQLRTYGSAEELRRPLGVAVDEKRQRVYVSDGAAHQIKAFDLDSGRLLFSIGSGNPSTREGDLHNPAGLALAADGRLYVVEHLNARISIFNPDGTFRRHICARDSSLAGFENPRAAAFDSEGNLWVVDFRRKALRAFDTEGRLLFAFEGPQKEKMGFSAPAGIHIDANDEIYLSDFLAARFSHWRYLSKAALDRHPITTKDLERLPKPLPLD